MRIPSNNFPDFLIPIYRGDTAAVFTTCRGEIFNGGNPYEGFSLCHYTGDSQEHFMRCRSRLADFLGIDPGRIVVPRQTHGTRCLTLDGIDSDSSRLEGVDALVTRCPGLVIGINTADCLPVAFVDEANGVIGVAHAGWRGAVGGIIGSTVEELLKNGASATATKVFMGPCICSDCFEVGPEVASRFPAKNVTLKEKRHVDLAGYVAGLLIEYGFDASNIHLPTECTKCNGDKYYSARRQGIASGRNFTFALISRQE